MRTTKYVQSLNIYSNIRRNVELRTLWLYIESSQDLSSRLVFHLVASLAN